MGYFPAFVLLGILGVVLLWFLCSFLYKPIGRFFHGLWKDAKDIIEETEVINEVSKDDKTSADKKSEKE